MVGTDGTVVGTECTKQSQTQTLVILESQGALAENSCRESRRPEKGCSVEEINLGARLRGRKATQLRRVLRRFWEGFWEGFWGRVLRRVLRRGPAMGFPVKRVLRRGFPEGA